MFGKKIVKRCPKGHEMELDWRRCPKCTGRSALHEGRDITEATVILGPGSAPADETRIVMPSQTGTSRAPGTTSAPPRATPPATWPGFDAPATPAASAPAGRPAPPPPAPAERPAPPAPATAPASSAKLDCTGGPLAGQAFPLALGVYKLGKAPAAGADFRVIAIPADRFASKEHAMLTVGTAQVVLSDPGSTNGTFVNGERATRVILKDGDEIRVGESFFRLTLGR